MSNVKERPILFSAPMVRAILDGRKTVTRRPVKGLSSSFAVTTAADESPLNAVCWNVGGPIIHCPYGKPGEQLWVRESFWHAGDWVSTYPEDDTGSWSGTARVHYRADGEPPNEPNRNYPNGLRNGAYSAAAPANVWRARPSIHMPRWACRILLEITDVRVERLQDISEDQAKAEGCFFTDYGQECFHGGTGWKDVGICPAPAGHRQRTGWAWDKNTSHEECLGTPRWAFANLWNATGGDWDANPWVWVVEFKRVQP